MPTLKKLKSKTRELKVNYGDDVLNVTYFSHAYTPRLEEESQISNLGAGHAMIDMMLPLIATWDLTNEYEVWDYIKSEETGEVDKNFKAPYLGPRRFVINGRGGKIGEWPQAKVDHEFAEGEEKWFVYVLEQVFEDGEPLLESKIVPVTTQGLIDVPVNVMVDIVKAVGEQLSPGEMKSSNSESSFA